MFPQICAGLVLLPAFSISSLRQESDQAQHEELSERVRTGCRSSYPEGDHISMQIYPEQLAGELARSFRLRYLVVGGESFLRQESVRTILRYARCAGFDDRLRFNTDGGDWDSLLRSHLEPDLFARNRVICLEVEQKVSQDVAQELARLFSTTGRDSVLIVCAPRFDLLGGDGWGRSFHSDRSLVVRCGRLSGERLRMWVASRSSDLGLRIDEPARRLLQQLCRNSPSVLHQKLLVLSTICRDVAVSSSQVRSVFLGDDRSAAERDGLTSGGGGKPPPDLDRPEVVESLSSLRVFQRKILAALKLRYHLLTGEEDGSSAPHREPGLTDLGRCVPLDQLVECVEELIEMELMRHQLSEQILRMRLTLLVSTFRQMVLEPLPG